MPSNAAAVWNHRGVLRVLVLRDLAVKYQQSILGYLWSLIEPLTMAVIYWFIFGLLFDTSLPDGAPYAMFIISGIFAWAWFNSAVNESTAALTSQAGLVTTVNLPREIFPIGRVVGRFAEYLAGIPILVGAALAFHLDFHWSGLAALVLAVALQFVLLTGIALLLSSVNVMLRDVERFIRLLVRVLFYAAPIIYPLSKVYETTALPDWVKAVYLADPLVGIFQLHHAVFFPDQWPSNALLAGCAAGCFGILGLGWAVFSKLEPAVLKEL